MSKIEIELKMKNGKFKKFTQDFIPFRKRVEYVKTEAELLKNENEEQRREKLADFQVEFVASLFEQEEVTGEAIYDGLDLSESDVIMDIILYGVLGLKRDELTDNPKK